MKTKRKAAKTRAGRPKRKAAAAKPEMTVIPLAVQTTAKTARDADLAVIPIEVKSNNRPIAAVDGADAAIIPVGLNNGSKKSRSRRRGVSAAASMPVIPVALKSKRKPARTSAANDTRKRPGGVNTKLFLVAPPSRRQASRMQSSTQPADGLLVSAANKLLNAEENAVKIAGIYGVAAIDMSERLWSFVLGQRGPVMKSAAEVSRIQQLQPQTTSMAA